MTAHDTENKTLFAAGEFRSHSGLMLPYKIDCDALTGSDIKTLAKAIAARVGPFSSVHGIPSGGVRLSMALGPLCEGGPKTAPMLIVDDVLTTGTSMEEARSRWEPVAPHHAIKGAVIFARGPVPDWVTPLFMEPAS